MRAEKAREISDEIVRVRRATELSVVLGRIKQAAESGEYDIEIESAFESTVNEELESLGYKVLEYWYLTELHTKVSWEE